MTNTFSVRNGERIIVAATPDIPGFLQGDVGIVDFEGRRMSRFDAKNQYTNQLLHPYRWISHTENILTQASHFDNAECFYSQANELGAYGMDGIVNYSQSSGPGGSAIHQYEPDSFTPDEVLGDMLSELNSGDGASSNHTALLMMLVGEDSFRNQVLSLLNAYRQETPVSPEVYENGQVHVLRLGYKADIEALIVEMGKPNEYESDTLIDPILAIPFENQNQIVHLKDILPGINLWQMQDVRYAVYEWNETHKGTAHMTVEMDYSHPENVTLCISKIA